MNQTEMLKRIVELFTRAAVRRLNSSGNDILPADVTVDVKVQYRVGQVDPVCIWVTESEASLEVSARADTLEEALSDALSFAEALDKPILRVV